MVDESAAGGGGVHGPDTAETEVAPSVSPTPGLVVSGPPASMLRSHVGQIETILTRRLPAESDLAPSTGPRQSFRGALVATLPALPFAALIATVTIYIAPWQATMAPWLLWLKANPLLVGTALAMLGWLVVAGMFGTVFGGTAADQANANAFSQLSQRLREIDARLAVARLRTDFGPSEQAALQRVQSNRDLAKTALSRSSPGWVLGTGYINAWGLIHRAEESLLAIEPVEDVVGAALYDELRLEGSQIDNHAQLLMKLRLAVTKLLPEAAIYLDQQPPAGAPGGAAAAAPSTISIQSARAVLRDIRQSINEFRDSSWDALVRTRNHLMGSLTVTGFVTYLLLALAISGRGADGPTNLLTDSIAAAATFYLVGASVGLFNRLYSESTSDNSVEDYGLTIARLSLTPVLSGLAAVGGALVIAMLPSAFSGEILTPAPAVVNPTPSTDQPSVAPTPQPAPVQAAATVRKAPPRLDEIYSLSGNPLGIILAAVFGLTPNLLIGALQNAGEKYRSGLQSTAAQ